MDKKLHQQGDSLEGVEGLNNHPFAFAAKLFAMLCMACTLGACSSSSTLPTTPTMYNTDKQLSCEDLQLEINEANFFVQRAEKQRSLTVGAIFSPVGYASRLMDAEDAIETAQTRIEYLNHIAEIKQCGRSYAQGGGGNIATVSAQMQPMQPSQQMQWQPVAQQQYAQPMPPSNVTAMAAPTLPIQAQPVGQMVRGADGRMWMVQQVPTTGAY